MNNQLAKTPKNKAFLQKQYIQFFSHTKTLQWKTQFIYREIPWTPICSFDYKMGTWDCLESPNLFYVGSVFLILPYWFLYNIWYFQLEATMMAVEIKSIFWLVLYCLFGLPPVNHRHCQYWKSVSPPSETITNWPWLQRKIIEYNLLNLFILCEDCTCPMLSRI